MFKFLIGNLIFLFSILVLPSEVQNRESPIESSLQYLNLKPKLIEASPIEQDNAIDETDRSPNSNLDLEFGNLTEEQYQGLMTFYRHVSRVPYDQSRIYYLTDFLTPQMQALYGLDFNSKLTQKEITGYHFYQYYYRFNKAHKGHGRLKKEAYKTQSSAQCWGTAANNIISLQRQEWAPTPFEVGFFDHYNVQKYLLSDEYSQLIL